MASLGQIEWLVLADIGRPTWHYSITSSDCFGCRFVLASLILMVSGIENTAH